MTEFKEDEEICIISVAFSSEDDPVVPGAKHDERCDECGVDVWIAPTSRAFLTEKGRESVKIFCTECSVGLVRACEQEHGEVIFDTLSGANKEFADAIGDLNESPQSITKKALLAAEASIMARDGQKSFLDWYK